jgi:hypothetical protein
MADAVGVTAIGRGDRPGVQTFLLGGPEPADGVRLWAFNQGFFTCSSLRVPPLGLLRNMLGI